MALRIVQPRPSRISPCMESGTVCLDVVAGCYERTVLGYEVVFDSDSSESSDSDPSDSEPEKNYKLRAKFTDNSHIGYIKAIAASKSFLASGSTDETIHLYNLQNNTELGTLLQHDGSITCICFHGDSHMISSSEDGTLCVWDTDSWDCMKTLRGHKGGVNCLAIHPSGKLALSVGVDKTLRTWNLLKGRPAFTTNIKQVADHVLWSPDGELYVVIIGGIINVYNITTASIACTMNTKSRINAVTFVTDRVLAVGGEAREEEDDFHISLLEIEESISTITCLNYFRAHKNRIKALQCVPACPVSNKSCRWLVSASSDGYIKLWNLDVNKLSEQTLVAKVNTAARLTCLTVRQRIAVEKDQETSPKTTTVEKKTSPKQTAVKRSNPSKKSGGKAKKKKVKP